MSTQKREMLLSEFIRDASFELQGLVSRITGASHISQHPYLKDHIYLYFRDEQGRENAINELFCSKSKGNLTTLGPTYNMLDKAPFNEMYLLRRYASLFYH